MHDHILFLIFFATMYVKSGIEANEIPISLTVTEEKKIRTTVKDLTTLSELQNMKTSSLGKSRDPWDVSKYHKKYYTILIIHYIMTLH